MADYNGIALGPGGEIGRRKGLKILFPARGVWVQVPPRAPLINFSRALDQAVGITKMAARLGRRDSIQGRRSDGGGRIDMQLLWENRRKYAH
jgi:hypothetical protein